MPLPPLRIPDEGHTYCRDLLGEKMCTGAKQGLPNYLPEDPTQPIKLRMVAVRMVDGGDYAPNGAYFGGTPGMTLYHVESVAEVPICQESWWTDDKKPHTRTARMFVRGSDRAAAKLEVLRKIPGATFFR